MSFRSAASETTPEANALRLFHEAVKSVPAYRVFLSDRGFDWRSVASERDFTSIPTTSKRDYILKHELPTLCRDGSLHAHDMLAVSSGSTGNPCIWPRTIADEAATIQRFGQVFGDAFGCRETPTLAVICFKLGTWVGGMYTVSCLRQLAAEGMKITTVTPGNDREEIFRVIAELGGHFEQIALCGYPPFLKDLIDSGIQRGVDWPRYRIKIVTAGEVFSEEWRTLVCERVGASAPSLDTASLYGTADAGVIANETPLSIRLRRYFAREPAAARELFGESRLPSLFQFDPLTRYLEQTEHNALLFTAWGGIPLIRYNILDTGGVVSNARLLDFAARHGWKDEAGKTLSKAEAENPFVYVFGRSDFTVSYFGANVFPENVTVGLEQPGIKEWVTGKFVMQVVEDEDRNPSLQVVVELTPGEVGSDERRHEAGNAILGELLRLNSEFANYPPPEHRRVEVTLRSFADPEFFPQGVKHRYTRKGMVSQ